MLAPFFCAFDALTIDDSECRFRVSTSQFAGLRVERVVQAREHAVAIPADHVVVDRTLRRKILRQLTPLAPRRQHVKDCIHDRPPVGSFVVAIAAWRRQVRLDKQPFVVGQIARVAQFVRS